MPDLEEVFEFSQSDLFLQLTMKPRPESISVRTLEGTKERLQKMADRGFGASMSEASHLCMQVGLLAFEERFEEE